MDLQLFAVNYRDYTDKALNKCRSKTVKQIENHLGKVANPLSYIIDDNPQKHNPRYVDGLKEQGMHNFDTICSRVVHIMARQHNIKYHKEYMALEKAARKYIEKFGKDSLDRVLLLDPLSLQYEDDLAISEVKNAIVTITEAIDKNMPIEQILEDMLHNMIF